MIHIIRATDLWMQPLLAATMFADRRKQFKERLGWSVQVDGHGYERDEYDTQNPIYIIIEAANGQHAGSLRLLPTTGSTMIQDHFSETLCGTNIANSRIWECTRFCIAPDQNHQIAMRLLAAGGRLMQEAGLQSLVAIFDPRMIKVYERGRVKPKLIGSHTYECGKVVSGYWSFSREKYQALVRLSQIDLVQLELAIANFSIPWTMNSNRAKKEIVSTRFV